MVMKSEPILKAIQSLKLKAKRQNLKVVLLSPRGKQFTQKMARDWAEKYKNIVLICGRYEGADERLKKILKADLSAKASAAVDEISIGPYILSGGELAAMVIVEAISRHIPGVLGKAESLEESRFGGGFPVYPHTNLLRATGWLRRSGGATRTRISTTESS